MLILSNTEYAIIINIIEYINTTYSPVVSFYAYVSLLKIFSLTSRVRLSVKKTLGYCADTKLVPLRTLKKKKKKNHCTHHLLLKKVFCQTRYRGRKASSDYECLSYGLEIPNTSVCSDAAFICTERYLASARVQMWLVFPTSASHLHPDL